MPALFAMDGGPGSGGGVEVAIYRQVHHAEHRNAVADQPDIDGELAGVLDEAAGAVQRIDQPEGRVVAGGRLAGSVFLLRDYGDIRGQVMEGRQDDGFGGVVRRRHRAAVRLHMGGNRVGVVAQNDLTGLPSDRLYGRQ